MSISVSGSQITFNDSSTQTTSPFTGGLGFRNRIINGAFMIDQRNAGASVTITNTGSVTYTLDRWNVYGSSASKFSVQQNAGSVTPPAGFKNYLGITSLAATSLGATDEYYIAQKIEGYNFADLSFGTSSASTFTISFWVRSSLTGTFGGAVNNSGQSRCYPFSYTISSANTWEQKTITIAGETTGTWNTTTGNGLQIIFSLGIGSTYSGTANAWTTSTIETVTGATSVVGTNGATFYITGVQLEKGSTATSFDYRPYGTELALCQRYFVTTYDTGVAVGSASNTGALYRTLDATASYASLAWCLPVTMRADPTVTINSPQTGASANFYSNKLGSTAGDVAVVVSTTYNGMKAVSALVNGVSIAATSFIVGHFTATAEL